MSTQKTETLYTPFAVGPLTLPNRVCMAPMTRARWAHPDLVAQYYAQRASAGLLIAESSSVSPLSISRDHSGRMDEDVWTLRWAKVADAVHAAGGRIFQQLYHLGRKSDPTRMPNGAQPVAPSAIACKGQIKGKNGQMVDFATPRALETSEIKIVVSQFKEAARRAKEAGLDGIELHGANQYLIHQFLSDGANTRTDAYGGPVPNRARFLLEIVDAVSTEFGADRVGVRVSPHTTADGTTDSDIVSLYGYIAEQLNARGIAYFHLVEAIGYGVARRSPPPGTPLVMSVVRAAFAGPLMVNGGYTAETAEAVVTAGRADLVSFGELYIANPDLVARLQRNGPYNQRDEATTYGGGEKGYVDYRSLLFV
jgi:N-ethylmaleimide reductase